MRLAQDSQAFPSGGPLLPALGRWPCRVSPRPSWRAWVPASSGPAAAGLAALLLTACGTGPDPAQPRTSGAATTIAGPNDAEEDLPALPPPPTWDQGSARSAARAARKVMRAFARPRVDARTWWAQLEPLLSPAARTAYAGTDPATIPASAVTGPPSLVDDADATGGTGDVGAADGGVSGGSSPYLARVAVPTDVGRYVVLLSRTAQDAPWLAERITPPGVRRAP